jgi:hypothetical protein
VPFAEAFALRDDIAGVGRVVRRDGFPVVLEVAADAVVTFELEVALLRALQQRRVVPGGAVEDCRRVGDGGHGAELAVELLLVHVLRLIDFEEELRGVADDVGVGFGGEEDEASAAELDDVAGLRLRERHEALLGQATPEAAEADLTLRDERRRALDALGVAAKVAREQERLEVRRELVLAALARELDREGEAALVEDALEDGAAGLGLVGTESQVPGEGCGAEFRFSGHC